MIVCVIEQCDDNEAELYFVDSDKLNPNDKVEKEILRSANKKAIASRTFVDLSDSYDEEDLPGVSVAAKCKPAKPDKVVYIYVRLSG